MRTYEERLEAGLLKLGWRRDTTDRSRYKAFTHPESESKLFVGKAGALRCGTCASKSFSLADPQRQTARYQNILKVGDEVLGPTRKQESTNVFEALKSN